MTTSHVSERVRNLWTRRSPAERRTLRLAVVVLSVILYLWFIQEGSAARAAYGSSVAVLQGQAAGMRQDALELGRLRTLPPPVVSGTALHALAETAVAASGLSGMLTRLDKVDADHEALVFGAVPFTNWLALTADLTAQGVRVDTVRIDSLATPGLVSITATLQRSSAQ